MANFCNRCGRRLVEGEVCVCKQSRSYGETSVKEIVQAAKEHMGIGEPEMRRGDVFETDMQIVPDCVQPNEGEVPVKQYHLATLQTRILGIPFGKAQGKLQVTNKRVIFRAPGRCIAGRTMLQHEFAVDELAGVETRREHIFSFGDFFIGCLVAVLSGVLITALMTALFMSGLQEGETAGAIFLSLLVGVAGCVPFFVLKKKWLLKILCLGGAFLPMMTAGGLISQAGGGEDGAAGFFGGLISFLGFVAVCLTLFAIFIYAIKPNLVLVIKTKSAGEAIDIRRKATISIFRTGVSPADEHTGYTEIIPAKDAECCIREINAIITDIQKLGDYGIEKWKQTTDM